MLSADLFSYLDSDNSSPNLEDNGSFPSDPMQQQQLSLSLFDDLTDVVDGATISIPDSNITSSLRPSGKVPSLEPVSANKIIEVKMSSDQEDDLVSYLTGKTLESEPPCLKLVCTTESNRSRNPQYVPFQDPGLCMSKNAIAAREMRQKKKANINRLESSLRTLQSENNNLKTQNTEMQSSIKELNGEVSYLRSILANQSALAGLLQNIGNTPGVKFQSSFLTGYNIDKQTKGQKPTAAVAGVVKRKAPRRKIIHTVEDKNDLFDENTPDRKKICDHQYAAKPTASMNTNFKILTALKKSSLRDTTDAVSTCHEENAQSNAGVCLHVSKGCVSLELCAMCNNQAKSSTQDYTEESI